MGCEVMGSGQEELGRDAGWWEGGVEGIEGVGRDGKGSQVAGRRPQGRTVTKRGREASARGAEWQEGGPGREASGRGCKVMGRDREEGSGRAAEWGEGGRELRTEGVGMNVKRWEGGREGSGMAAK